MQNVITPKASIQRINIISFRLVENMLIYPRNGRTNQNDAHKKLPPNNRKSSHIYSTHHVCLMQQAQGNLKKNFNLSVNNEIKTNWLRQECM